MGNRTSLFAMVLFFRACHIFGLLTPSTQVCGHFGSPLLAQPLNMVYNCLFFLLLAAQAEQWCDWALGTEQPSSVYFRLRRTPMLFPELVDAALTQDIGLGGNPVVLYPTSPSSSICLIVMGPVALTLALETRVAVTEFENVC